MSLSTESWSVLGVLYHSKACTLSFLRWKYLALKIWIGNCHFSYHLPCQWNCPGLLPNEWVWGSAFSPYGRCFFFTSPGEDKMWLFCHSLSSVSCRLSLVVFFQEEGKKKKVSLEFDVAFLQAWPHAQLPASCGLALNRHTCLYHASVVMLTHPQLLYQFRL